MNKHNIYIALIVSALLALMAAPLLAQQTHNAGIQYGTGTPVYTPSNQGSRLYIDLVTGVRYNWNINTLAWQADAQGIMRTTGGTPPLAAPGYGQPGLALNYASPPELYVYVGPTGTDWLCLNCVEATNVTAGTGIAVTGTPPNITVTNTAPNVVQTLSVSGDDLTLSGGGGTVTIPGDGNGIYGGSGTVPDGTVAQVGDKGALEFGGDDPEKIALTWRDAASGISHIVSVGSASLDFRAEYDDGSNPTQSVIFQANSSAAAFASDKSALEFNTKGGTVLFSAPDVALVFDDTGAAPELKINDDRSVPNGLVYTGDYSDTIIENDPSVPDVRTVKKMLGSATTVTGATSAAANANAITAGLSTGQPYRWDDGDSVHLMFVR